MSIGLLRLFYALVLGSTASLIPLLGGRLEAAHLAGGEVGFLLALLPFGRLVSAPLWTVIADRWRLGGLMLRGATAASAVAGMVVIRSDDPMVLAVAMFAYSALRSPIGSILDAFVVDALRERGEPPESYGRVRLYGSLGFLLGVAGAGWVERAGLPLPAFVDALFVATAIVAFAFPARGEGGPAPVLPALLGLAKQPFLLPLLVTGGLQAMTLSVYDTFLSVHVQAHGLPTLLVGASVGIGVSFETALLAFGRDWLGRMGPARALLFAAASGIPRWILTAIVREPALLVAIQVLHGIGFGAFWVSGVQRMARAAPPHISASAQALWGAATYGVGALIGALLAGQVRERVGTEGIFWMLAVVSVGATASAGWLVWADGTGESGSEADAKSVGIGRLN